MFCRGRRPSVLHVKSTKTAPVRKEVAMSELIHGACLCGAIAFELQESYQYGPDRAMGTCHCTRCRRWSGGSGLPFVVVAPERFKVIRGQELMARYRDAGSAMRTFCRRCGSSLYQDNGTTYHVGAGVLDDLQLTPTFHIQVAHKAPWDEIAGDAPQFAEMPTAPTAEKRLSHASR
jgi:hypothetical protein